MGRVKLFLFAIVISVLLWSCGTRTTYRFCVTNGTDESILVSYPSAASLKDTANPLRDSVVLEHGETKLLAEITQVGPPGLDYLQPGVRCIFNKTKIFQKGKQTAADFSDRKLMHLTWPSIDKATYTIDVEEGFFE